MTGATANWHRCRPQIQHLRTEALWVPTVASEGEPWRPHGSPVQEATLAPSWERVKATTKEFSKTYFEIITIVGLKEVGKSRRTRVQVTQCDTTLRQGHWSWCQQVLCHFVMWTHVTITTSSYTTTPSIWKLQLTHITPGLRGLRQGDCCKFKASLGYTMSTRLANATW